MLQDLRRKLTVLFLSLTMLAFTAVLAVLAGSSVSSVRRSEELFLSNIADSIAERFPEPSVQKRYAEKYGICILPAQGSWVAPEGMPIEDLLSQRDAQNVLFMMQSDMNGRQISKTLYALSGSAGSFYALELTVFPEAEEIQRYQILAPRETLWHIFRQHCIVFPFLWLAMLLALFLISHFLIQKALMPVQAAIKGQQEFVAAASHELKAPLSVIHANAETALNRPEDTEKRLTLICTQCIRMGKLVEALLDLEARDAGHWILHKTLIDVDSLLIEVWEDFREPVARNQMQLQLDLNGEVFPKFQADPDRLKQALGILLDNACTYGASPEGIRLGASLGKGCLILSVMDHGSGIRDWEKQKVFRRFYRSDPARTEKNHFGLGLSIAQEIAAAHHGQIHLLDTPGGGCTVEMVLPIS